MLAKTFIIRNLNADGLGDRFVVSAVAAILLIRLYLELTGYPRIGGGGLHIAHMLWGGLLMLAAIVVLLSFLSASAYRLAAILGGVGFGTFIDELGKFITSDNNYFFEPTVSLIYVIFVLLYLAFQYIERYRPATEAEYLVNSLDAVKEAIIRDLDPEEEQRAKMLLARCDPANPLVPVLTNVIDQFQCLPPRQPSRWTAPVRWARASYPWLVQQGWFPRLVIAFFTLQALGTILQSVVLTVEEVGLVAGLLAPYAQPLSLSEFGDVLFSLIAGIFVIVGVVRFRRSRLAAYRMFRIAVLISLLLTQFFQFYAIQFGALVGFMFDWALLILLAHLIERETSLQRQPAPGDGEAPRPIAVAG